MSKQGLLLDTHVWLWLVNGNKTLTPKIRKTINAAVEVGAVFISAISSWEISMLESHKRITLNRPCLDWISTSFELTGIQPLALNTEIAVESCQLPEALHGDPADRMIVATARLNDLSVVTRDAKIIEYSGKNYVKAIAA